MSADEIVILVDEADNILGYKKRGELLPDDRWRISAVWIDNSLGQVLIAQRADSLKNDPGCWGPACAGTVNKDEDYEQNALKELREEIGVTGVSITPGTKLPYISSRGNHRVCQWFALRLDWPVEKFMPDPNEVKNVRWINKADLAEDLKAHPEKYVGSAAFWPELFGVKK